MKKFSSLLSALLCVLFSTAISAQSLIQKYTPSESEVSSQVIKATKASYFVADLSGIQNALQNAPYREDVNTSNFYIKLPNLEGGFDTYNVMRNKTMHPDLNALYPSILTFDGHNINDRSESAKFDITPQGFHAMIFSPNHSTIFIDPIHPSAPNKLMAYYKKDFYTNKTMACQFDDTSEDFEELITGGNTTPEYGTCQLRTYRLALAATAEYTAYHTNATLAAAAQVTTMNRVNGVYERDIAITMTLVPNNNLLIYTNAGSDPYTNGNAGAMITENVSNCNLVIGSTNYDIGHVFGTNSGGLAGLGVVCGSNKARGVTGSSNPIGDPFDIDYVAHEVGHQFKANHTQNNSCNRNNATAVEPGSASTIMGYAGICAPNVQNNSDDHFHGISLSEMSNFITSGSHGCPVITPLSNNAPVISGTNGNVSIPANTPFALTCIASDIDNDPMTYNWEQTDNDVSTQSPVASSTSGPNFRSLPSSASPTRYFPNLTDLSNGGPFTWEVIPSVSRTMNFRVSVRDNAAGPGGCQDFENVTVSTVASAGPFVVNYPSFAGIVWSASTTETVTWAVANTTAAPINAALVDIYLSIDGGLTYPTLLVAGTANDGSEPIPVPSLATTTARIMVINSGGTFFDISDNNFEITNTGCAQPSVPVVSGVASVCSGESTTLSLTGSLNDATQWQWYSGACGGTMVGTGMSINLAPGATTTYFVRGTGGCVTNAICANQTVTVTNMNMGVSQSGTVLTSLQPGASYQWLDCSNNYAVIPGATNVSFTPTMVIGSYAVEVTQNGCIDTSICTAINTTGLNELVEIGLSIAPNPTQDKADLSWDLSASVETIEVLDANGRVVITTNDIVGNQHLVNLSNLESAVYFIRLTHAKGVENVRLLKTE